MILTTSDVCRKFEVLSGQKIVIFPKLCRRRARPNSAADSNKNFVTRIKRFSAIFIVIVIIRLKSDH